MKMKLKRSKREKEVVSVVETISYSRIYFGPEEPTLQLECWEEELSPCQLEAYKKIDQEYDAIKNKLNSIVKDCGGEVVYAGDECVAYSVAGSVPDLTELSTSSASTVQAPPPPPAPVKSVIGKKKGRKEKEPKYVPPPSPPSPEPKFKETKKSTRGRDKSKTVSPTPPTSVQSVSSGVRPSEASAIGGLATGTGNKNAIVDLTKDDAKNAPDSREVAFNKLQGKTFPSLVVVARPYLRTKEGAGNSDRAALDSKVKSVLMHTPTKFTEWLIQQGLVRSEQICAIHPYNKLKLGMYSDVSKFPYSGGYVWISECCPTRFLSVFSGSLFEGATQPPSVLLKLIYHWACQTNVQNVVQWVKVDNLYVKSLFTWLRAVCTAALHHHMTLMGGSGKRIEVGVISLGTTSHDGLQRQVKVEVLGILDVEAKLVRLRAVEPLADGERNYKKRFQKILEPLGLWVHTDSIILTDLTVDKGTLLQMGFKTVHQSSNSDTSSKNSNAGIMEYLRKIVPRMFQNTLSLLSRQIIQQFLDELVWREWYGTSPGQAFDNIVSHLAEQTRLDAKDNLVVRLAKISSNPFKNWKYASMKNAKGYVQIAPPAVVEAPKEPSRRGRKRKHQSIIPVSSPSPPPPPVHRGRGSHKAAKETRKRKRVNYIEADDDDDDDVILMDAKKDKRFKKKHEDKKIIEFDKKEFKKNKQEKKVKEEKFKIEKREKRKDGGDLKISIKKDTKQDDQMVNLGSYYFGVIENQDRSTKKQILVQCTECSSEFEDIIKLQLHLFMHALPNSTDMTEVNPHQCRYCLHDNIDAEALADHLSEYHPSSIKSKKKQLYYCLICEISFSSLSTLSTHMQKNHVQFELPYSCGACCYRVSSHRTCIDHFYKCHQYSTTLQCPFCLKMVKAFADKCDLRSNVDFFVNHLRQHLNQNLSLRCNRCSLKFVHLGALKEHQVIHHTSVFGAGTLCNEVFLINKPKIRSVAPVKDTMNHIFVDVFDDLVLRLPNGYICKECNSQLEEDRHFLGTYNCTKCTYQTSCWKAQLHHGGICQNTKELGQLPVSLPDTYYCICSYSTTDGNAMAAHMALCERHSAYISEDQAKLNTIEVSLSKESVMDSLCLQRNKDVDYTSQLPSESINDFSAPPSVLNTQLSLDDLAPPSVLQHDQMDLEPLKNEAYEQPLATPQVQHDEMDVQVSASEIAEQSHSVPLGGQSLDSYMDSTGEFEPLPAEPMPQPEFEPL